MQKMWVHSLDQEDPMEKEMAAHSNILAWEIPRTEEPGGLQSMGLPRVRHNWAAEQEQQNLSVMILDSAKATGKSTWEPVTFTLFQDCSPNLVQCSGKEEHLLLRDLGQAEYGYFMTIPE